jgi:hypothetical protein
LSTLCVVALNAQPLQDSSGHQSAKAPADSPAAKTKTGNKYSQPNWPFSTNLRVDSAVAGVIRSRLGSLWPIYERFIGKKPGLSGRMLAAAVVDERGAVSGRPTIERATLDSKEMIDKVLDSVSNWRFGPVASGKGTDTLQFALSFGEAENLVHVSIIDAQVDGKEYEPLRKKVAKRLSDVKEAYLSQVGFYGAVEGVAKLAVGVDGNGKGNDVKIAWHSGLPDNLLDTLLYFEQGIKDCRFPEGAKGILVTSSVRFEDLHDAPFLVLYGSINHSPDYNSMPNFNTFSAPRFVPTVPVFH